MPKYIIVLCIKCKRKKLLERIILVKVIGLAITGSMNVYVGDVLDKPMILTQPCA
jgi:hypothetical protein